MQVKMLWQRIAMLLLVRGDSRFEHINLLTKSRGLPLKEVGRLGRTCISSSDVLIEKRSDQFVCHSSGYLWVAVLIPYRKRNNAAPCGNRVTNCFEEDSVTKLVNKDGFRLLPHALLGKAETY